MNSMVKTVFYKVFGFYLELFHIDSFVSEYREFGDNIINSFRFSTEVKFRIGIKMVFDKIYPSGKISGNSFLGNIYFISESVDFFDPIFIEKILFVRYRKEKLFCSGAVFRHIDERDYSYSCTDKYFGKLGILYDKISENTFDCDFAPYRSFSDDRTSSAMFREFYGKNKHGFFIISILINNRVRSLEGSLFIFK